MITRAAALTTLSLGALACSSSPGTATGPGNDAGSDVTFTEVYTTVIGPVCSTCHAANGEAPFLVMSSQSAAYTNLVGVKASGPSCGSSGDTRVVAGSAPTSLLYEKVSMTTPPCGGQMPLGGSPLSAADQGLFAAWINAGAKND
jgi:hypothetical protein